jgi:hypothetical protein
MSPFSEVSAEPVMYSRHTRSRSARRARSLRRGGLEVAHPRPERLRVALAKRFHVADPQPGRSHRATHAPAAFPPNSWSASSSTPTVRRRRSNWRPPLSRRRSSAVATHVAAARITPSSFRRRKQLGTSISLVIEETVRLAGSPAARRTRPIVLAEADPCSAPRPASPSHRASTRPEGRRGRIVAHACRVGERAADRACRA